MCGVCVVCVCGVCVCVRACVRACMRACVRACVANVLQTLERQYHIGIEIPAICR